MKTSIYRIYTERRQNLASLVSGYFDGFTLIDASGHWRGLAEPSAVIEVIQDGDETETRRRVYDLAEAIRAANDQTAVLVTEQSADALTFTKDGAA